MDFAIQTDGATADLAWESATNISNNVWLSLMVEKGSFFARPGFGSRLRELSREKNTGRARALAAQYAKEALQWLIDLGRATHIEAVAEHAERGVNLEVAVTQADGQMVTYNTFVEVG